MVKTCGLTLVIHSFEGMFSFTLIFFKNFISISFYVTLAYSKKNLRLDGQCRGKRVLLLTQVWSSKHRITLSYILDSLCCFVFWNFKSSLINIFHLTVLKRPRMSSKVTGLFPRSLLYLKSLLLPSSRIPAKWICQVGNNFTENPPATSGGRAVLTGCLVERCRQWVAVWVRGSHISCVILGLV